MCAQNLNFIALPLPEITGCTPKIWEVPGYANSVGLIVHAISFQDLQPMWSWSTNVTDVQTDRLMDDTQSQYYALHLVHHMVKTRQLSYRKEDHSMRPIYGCPQKSWVLTTLSTYGRRAFSVAGPTVWNSLPEVMRDPECSVDSYRQSLKTFLFSQY